MTDSPNPITIGIDLGVERDSTAVVMSEKQKDGTYKIIAVARGRGPMLRWRVWAFLAWPYQAYRCPHCGGYHVGHERRRSGKRRRDLK